MEDSQKKEELTIYNLYKTLKVLLEKIKMQSGRELENIQVIYNQKLVEVGNRLKENNLTFSMVTELTNTINNKMMNYIKEASKALNEYVEIMEASQIKNKNELRNKVRTNFLNKIFKKNTENNEVQSNIKENIALEKYDEMVCNLKLFKIEKDIKEAIEEYINENKGKGQEFINQYKKNVKEQLNKLGINTSNI